MRQITRNNANQSNHQIKKEIKWLQDVYLHAHTVAHA